MLIALEYSVVDVQHRLGHQSPDTTLRIYAHIWKYRDAQRSDIGNRVNTLLTHTRRPNEQKALPPPQTRSTPGHEEISTAGSGLTTSANP